jgi:glucan phosphoethanolaminetransferase (alkaline phosphatase superfamily)
MKKSLWIISLFAIILTKFASAQFGTSERLTLGDLLNMIDPTTMILGVVFVVSFALLFFSLSRVFRGEKAIAGIVSLAMSLLIAYGINKSGIDLENLVYDMGITLETLHIIFPIFIIALVVIFIVFIVLRTGKKAKRQLRGGNNYGPG